MKFTVFHYVGLFAFGLPLLGYNLYFDSYFGLLDSLLDSLLIIFTYIQLILPFMLAIYSVYSLEIDHIVHCFYLLEFGWLHPQRAVDIRVAVPQIS